MYKSNVDFFYDRESARLILPKLRFIYQLVATLAQKLQYSCDMARRSSEQKSRAERNMMR